jgi:16S rRNA (cytidine1402-2'-O)-methyltransferase
MGKLTIVPTPIGNLDDITLRAIKVLETADLILAEDTRQTSKLLKHYNIKSPCRSFHQHNEHRMAENIARELAQSDLSYALVSDAGTPGISDPAYLLINKCIEFEVDVECLPGATAFVPALIESGLPSDAFVFLGFLPHQKGRSKILNELKDEDRTMIFYESPYRIIKTLTQFCEVFGNNRLASVSRELTKIYSETCRSSLEGLLEKFKQKNIKGEFVIIVHGKK